MWKCTHLVYADVWCEGRERLERKCLSTGCSNEEWECGSLSTSGPISGSVELTHFVILILVGRRDA
jgi:hypothetical protein